MKSVGSCSGACSGGSITPAVSESRKQVHKDAMTKFGVYCLTVSDRASKGEYKDGDLSGKAMLGCIEANSDHFEAVGSK